MRARRVILASAVLILAIWNLVFPEAGQYNVNLEEVRLRLGDSLLVILWPPVKKISSSVNASGDTDYLYAVSTREISPITALTGNIDVSLVEVMPNKNGMCTLLINFTSVNDTRVIYGAITSNVTFYGTNPDLYQVGSNNYYVLMQPSLTLPPSNGTISIRMNIIKPQSEDGSIFDIQLPPFSRVVFITVLLGLLIYWNSYLILDAYFMSKTEDISTIRKILTALSIGLSALIVYVYVWR